jgi:hypothetical protein
MKMADPVFEHLEVVVDNWCDLEAGSYGTGMPLVNMWSQAHPVSPPYDPDGIESLLLNINEEPFFNPMTATSRMFLSAPFRG